MKYIVCSDLSDPAVLAAANALKAQYLGAAIADFNQASTWSGATGDTMFLVGHGNGIAFEGYSNPSDLFRDYSEVKTVFDTSGDVVLISCSTASEAQTILKNGFQAGTFAKNLSSYDSAKKIHAAVGPVYADSFGDLVVEKPSGAEGIASDDGWVAYEAGSQDMNEISPFK